MRQTLQAPLTSFMIAFFKRMRPITSSFFATPYPQWSRAVLESQQPIAGIAIYGMSSSVSPEDFLLQVRALLTI
jgi:hypothetical protein